MNHYGLFTRAQLIVGIIALVGLAVSAGFQLNRLNLGEIASDISSERQVAALGLVDHFNDAFRCLNGTPATITTANTVSNPVIIPFVGEGACDSALPAIVPDALSLPSGINAAGFIIDGNSGRFTGSDGNTYGLEAIRHSTYQAPTADYPQGFFKFYFTDLAKTKSQAPTGSMTVYLGYKKSPKILILDTNVNASTSIIYDLDREGRPMTKLADRGSFFVDANQRPVVSLRYSTLGVTSGKVRERIWASDTSAKFSTKSKSLEIAPTYDRTVNVSGSADDLYTISWSPVSKEPGKLYVVSVCPVKDDQTVDGYCTVRNFVTTKPSPVIGFASGSKGGILDKCVKDGTMPATGADLVFSNPDKTVCNVGRQSTNNPIYQDVICYQSGGPWQDYPGAPYPGDLRIISNLSSAIASHIHSVNNGKENTEYHLQRSKERAIGPDLSFKVLFPARGGAKMSAALTQITSVLDTTTGKKKIQTTNDSGQLGVIVQGVGKMRQHCNGDEFIAMNQEGRIILYAIDSEKGNLAKIADFGVGLTPNVVRSTVQVGKNLGGKIGHVIGFGKTKKAGSVPDGNYPWFDQGEAYATVTFLAEDDPAPRGD